MAIATIQERGFFFSKGIAVGHQLNCNHGLNAGGLIPDHVRWVSLFLNPFPFLWRFLCELFLPLLAFDADLKCP
eukprot:3891483-Ditylum_brightwellii.AAC.1